jgi:hypothetical protein
MRSCVKNTLDRPARDRSGATDVPKPLAADTASCQCDAYLNTESSLERLFLLATPPLLHLQQKCSLQLKDHNLSKPTFAHSCHMHHLPKRDVVIYEKC